MRTKTPPPPLDEGAQQPERVLIYRDVNAITRTLADLNAACRHFNDTIAELSSRELLPLGLTNEIVTQMCFYDCSAIVDALERAEEAEPKVTRSERRNAAKLIEAEIMEIHELFLQLTETMQRRKLQDGMTLTEHERSVYLIADNGKVSFNRADVVEYFSRYLEGEPAKEYAEEARRVFNTLAEFDRKTRLLSNNTVRGVGDAEPGAIPEIIAVHNGKIHLDFYPISDLVFEGVEKRAQRMTINNTEIINPER